MDTRLAKMLIAGSALLFVANLGATAFLWVRLGSLETKTKRLKDRLAELEPTHEAAEPPRQAAPALAAVPDIADASLEELRSAMREARTQAPQSPAREPRAEDGVPVVGDPAIAGLAAATGAAIAAMSSNQQTTIEELSSELQLNSRQSRDLRETINEARQSLYDLQRSAQQGQKLPYPKRFNALKKKTYADLKTILSPEQYRQFQEKKLGLFSIDTGFNPFIPES